MREGIIIGEFQRLQKLFDSLVYNMRLGFSGNALHEEALKTLLMKKGIITETEFKEALGEKIKEINAQQVEAVKKAEEVEKTELVKPTPAETAKIDASKDEKK